METKSVLFIFVLSIILSLLSSIAIAAECNSYATYPTATFNYNTNNKSQTYGVGVVGTFSAKGYTVLWMLYQAAIDLINDDLDLLPDVQLVLYQANTYNNNSNALLASQHVVNNLKVKALISGVTVSETGIAHLVASLADIPQVIPLAMAATFMDRAQYPNIARVVPNDYSQARAVINFIKQQGWRQILLVYSDDASGEAGATAVKLLGSLSDISVYTYQIKSGLSDYSSYIPGLQAMVKQYRLRVFLHYLFVSDADVFFRQLKPTGLMDSEYAHIFTYYTAGYITYNYDLYPWSEGTIGLTPVEGEGPLYEKFMKRWNAFEGENNWVQDPRIIWLFADALLSIAYTLKMAMEETGLPVANITGDMQMKYFSKLSFLGVTGNVTLDSNNERLGNFNWFNFGKNFSRNYTSPMGYYDVTKDTTVLRQAITVGSDGNSVIYDGICTCIHGTCTISGQCVCYRGYSGNSCDTPISRMATYGIVLLVVLPIVFLIFVVIGATHYVRTRKAKVIKEIKDKQNSSILRSDIAIHAVIGRGASGVVHKAMFRGTEVAVKKIVTNVSKFADQSFELESAVLSGLRHPNIVLFFGSCLDTSTKEMLLVMEYLDRGSLHDILHNKKIPFSLELAIHIASQAAKGMNFLHQASPPIIHRDLKSHNILLDNKWNARISDFGISKIKDLTHSSKRKTPAMGTIFWTAPEVFGGFPSTEKSDVYAFGIVLWEMMHRDRQPYEGYDPMSVALDVLRRGLRPSIYTKMIPEYEELMLQCWEQDPTKRPTFQEITHRLKSLTVRFPVLNFGDKVEKIDHAPEGHVVFVQTEINGGNLFWDRFPNDMLEAVGLHNELLRFTMQTYEGYEVECGSNGFLIAFEDLAHAIHFCISVQHALLKVSWPQNITSMPLGSKVFGKAGEVIWNGLRVRMAINSGVPNSAVEPSTGRTKYFGSVVKKVKRMLFYGPWDVSIVTSGLIVEQISIKKIALCEPIISRECGTLAESSRLKCESLYSLLPVALDARLLIENNPHVVVEIDQPRKSLSRADTQLEMTSVPSSPRQEKLLWNVNYDHLQVMEIVGTGAIGDYYHGFWNGKEVALKALKNQKLEEYDILHLKSKISILSKIKHSNLLQVYGVCFKPGNITIVMEYLPNSGLRELLSDASVSLSYKAKLHIAKQVANGMEYLSKFDDPEICIHGNLNSNNILVNRDTYEVKITDFGQGRLKDLARTTTAIGSIAWTAPEVLERTQEITPTISVYAYGIILYEIFTRKIPFAGDNPITLVSSVVQGGRPDDCASFPPDYKQLMEQCWNADPKLRPKWPAITTTLSIMLNSLQQ